MTAQTIHTFNSPKFEGYYNVLQDGEIYTLSYTNPEDASENEAYGNICVTEDQALEALGQRIDNEVTNNKVFTDLYGKVLHARRVIRWREMGLMPSFGTVHLSGVGNYLIFSTADNGFGWTFFDDVEDDEMSTGYDSVQDAVQGALDNAEETLTFEKDRESARKALTPYL